MPKRGRKNREQRRAIFREDGEKRSESAGTERTGKKRKGANCGFNGGKGRQTQYSLYDELLFDGEIVNGEKNGKGKEYNDENNLVYEGEYLNGERWKGIGKEYNDEGKLEYEGEYLNGERNGKGKEYYYNGELEFEGEYLNGERWNGKGNECLLW